MIPKKISRALLLLIPVCLLLFLLKSCNSEDEGDEPVIKNIYVSELTSPKNGAFYKAGEAVNMEVKYKDGGKTLEEIDVFLDGKTVLNASEKKASYTINFDTDSIGLGPHTIIAESKIKGSANPEIQSSTFTVLSDTKPEEYGYKVITKYPHDAEAFTQGLYIDNGLMYEGTGQEGASEIRLWDFKQNKILKSVPLGPDYFGEGIAQVGDKIYQLTYKSRKGFVYDKKTFALLRSFDYPTEGWGLTYDGTHLIMTDGSNTLFFYEPENFRLVKKVQVADDQGLIADLNELEYINGEIWANVWRTDWMLQIDPATGKVKSRINFKSLLPLSERTQYTDVLNGIAWDPATGKLYVTGKYWPWLYEIERVKPAV